MCNIMGFLLHACFHSTFAALCGHTVRMFSMLCSSVCPLISSDDGTQGTKK